MNKELLLCVWVDGRIAIKKTSKDLTYMLKLFKKYKEKYKENSLFEMYLFSINKENKIKIIKKYKNT